MLVEIKNLCKRYESKAEYTIENINIQGNAGEIIGILGHNGAGKSTTIKCITGMHPYEEGSISIAGHDLASDSILAKQNFGYVSDEHILFEKMTGFEFVNFMADIYNVSLDERKLRIDIFMGRSHTFPPQRGNYSSSSESITVFLVTVKVSSLIVSSAFSLFLSKNLHTLTSCIYVV